MLMCCVQSYWNSEIFVQSFFKFKFYTNWWIIRTYLLLLFISQDSPRYISNYNKCYLLYSTNTSTCVFFKCISSVLRRILNVLVQTIFTIKSGVFQHFWTRMWSSSTWVIQPFLIRSRHCVCVVKKLNPSVAVLCKMCIISPRIKHICQEWVCGGTVRLVSTWWK